jgi:hypothetical protein
MSSQQLVDFIHEQLKTVSPPPQKKKKKQPTKISHMAMGLLNNVWLVFWKKPDPSKIGYSNPVQHD